jgi:hypothetical protein
MSIALLGVLLALPSTASAQDLQYRRFKLSDGRDFVAIIEATEASGFRVRVPQGITHVPFAQLFDMVPVTQKEYDTQEDWAVYLAAPEERKRGLVAAFQGIPHVRVYGFEPGPDVVLPPETMQTATACDVNLTCLSQTMATAPWMWLVVAHQEGADIVFEAQTNKGGPARNPTRAGMIDANAISNSAWGILDLTPGGGTSTTVIVPPTPPVDNTERDRKRLALSYAPVPGLPSLAARHRVVGGRRRQERGLGARAHRARRGRFLRDHGGGQPDRGDAPPRRAGDDDHRRGPDRQRRRRAQPDGREVA